MSTDFGKDVSCSDSLRTGRLVRSVRLVAEAYVRRLSTPRGALRGGDQEADYGIDLTELVGQDASLARIASLPAIIRNELQKDERTLSVEVNVRTEKLVPETATRLIVEIEAETSEGPFALKIGVSSVTVELLELVSEEAA